MTRYLTCLRTLLPLLIVLTAVSASEAGLFGRWRTRNDYYAPACPAVATSPASSTPAAGQPMASTAGPKAYTAMKPVIGDNTDNTAGAAPQGGQYVPAQRVYSSPGWSATPRSSWDFGNFPPYH